MGRGAPPPRAAAFSRASHLCGLGHQRGNMASALEQFVNSVRQLSAQGKACGTGLGLRAVAPVRMLGPPLALALPPGPARASVPRVGAHSGEHHSLCCRALSSPPAPSPISGSGDSLSPSPPALPSPWLSGPCHSAPLDSLGA